MRRVFIIFTSVLCIVGHGQNVKGIHQPHVDGQVKKVGITYPALELTGKDVVWNFSDLEVSDDVYLVNYVATDSPDSIIAGIEQRTRFYYRTSNDSVLLCGYENNQNKVVYNQPQLLLRMPLEYNQQDDGFFHGTAVYCEKLFMRVFGSYTVKVDGTGSLILPSGDTLRHVSRVHTQLYTDRKHYPSITTEEELQFIIDSIAPYTNDSIRCKLAKDNMVKRTDMYRWYAVGYRYPIIEAFATGSTDMPWKHQTAYFCSPSEQESLEDNDNEQIRNHLTLIDYTETGRNHDYGNDNGYPILKNVHVNVGETAITVYFDLIEDAAVTALISGVSGIAYRQVSQNVQAGVNQFIAIPCSDLRRGQYVLYMKSNGKVVSFAVTI